MDGWMDWWVDGWVDERIEYVKSKPSPLYVYTATSNACSINV